MAGHSHWAQIKRKKAVVDKRRGKVFAKLLRAVEVAARDAGTSNPDNNMTLAAAVERAKSSDVPLDNIERAAKRGAGELDEGVRYERVLYEGYAPGGVAILVEALTDNRNRTAQEIRAVFNKQNGSLGEPGSVAYLFEQKGIIIVDGAAREDEVLLAAAEGGADDASHQGDRWEIICDAKDFAAVRDAVVAGGLAIESADLTMLPTSTVPVDGDGARPVLRLMDGLDDLDDVQGVYTNFDVPEEVLAEVS